METVDIETTYSEKEGLPNCSSREFRATIGRTVSVEGPEILVLYDEITWRKYEDRHKEEVPSGI